jgi:hypothetical protein
MKDIPTHSAGKAVNQGRMIQHLAHLVIDLILASLHFSTPDYLAPGEDKSLVVRCVHVNSLITYLIPRDALHDQKSFEEQAMTGQ